jgi:hypothetical protein
MHVQIIWIPLFTNVPRGLITASIIDSFKLKRQVQPFLSYKVQSMLGHVTQLLRIQYAVMACNSTCLQYQRHKSPFRYGARTLTDVSSDIWKYHARCASKDLVSNGLYNLASLSSCMDTFEINNRI